MLMRSTMLRETLIWRWFADVQNFHGHADPRTTKLDALLEEVVAVAFQKTS